MTRVLTLPAATKARLLGGGLVCAAAGLVGCGWEPHAGVITGHVPPISPLPEKYRFALPPVVVFLPSAGPPAQYRLFVRTNRALPRNTRGIRPTFQLDGATGSFGRPVTYSRQPSCYGSDISAGDNPRAPQNIIHPHDGQLVTVTMRFPGRDGASATVALRAVPPPTLGADHLAIKSLRGLGCHISLKAMSR
jgi:hypothetical protein